MDAIKHDGQDDGFLFRCPEAPKGQNGYACNAALSRSKPPARLETVPLIYDSTDPRRNASDFVTSLPRLGRHSGKNNVAYADGHAKAVAP